MNKTQFLSLVRQYAEATRRKRVSYKIGVLSAYDLFSGWLISDGARGEALATELAWARGVIDREYVPNDSKFEWPSEP